MASSKYQASRSASCSKVATTDLRHNVPQIPYDISSSTTFSSGGKELPIMLVLDVSPSMGIGNRIHQQNEAVKAFLTALAKCSNPKVRKATRIAFCLFTDGIVYQTIFMKLDELTFPDCEYLEKMEQKSIPYIEDSQRKSFSFNVPVFKAAIKARTHIPYAVQSAVDIMQTYVRYLSECGTAKYTPFLVFTSDGNPDLNTNEAYTSDIRNHYMAETEKAAQKINTVCNPSQDINDLIIPFFIGVGEAEQNYLRSFCEHFPSGILMVDSQDSRLTFSNIFGAIARAIAQSVNMSYTSEKLLINLTNVIQQVSEA